MVSYGPGSKESQLVSLERLWNEAQVHRDSQALATMIGDKFVDTEWDGEVSDRGKFLADIADPKFEATSLTIEDVKVNLFQNTAVVTGTYRAKGSYRGKSYKHVGRFTDTWVFADAMWQCGRATPAFSRSKEGAAFGRNRHLGSLLGYFAPRSWPRFSTALSCPRALPADQTPAR
jgi:ketosteroid isomerase-like protein